MSDLVIPPQAPHGYAEIIAHYGDPKIRKNGDGSWSCDPKWESDNCITVRHGLLPTGKLFVHKLVAQPLLRTLDRWAARIAAGDQYRVRTLGCYSPRAQRGSAGLIPSTHSWAIAFDLNADQNPLITGLSGPADPRRYQWGDIPLAWAQDAIAEGWFWGRDFQTRCDGQHFQLASGY